MFVTLRGEPHVLRRPNDEHGTELDILLQKRRKPRLNVLQARAALEPDTAQNPSYPF